MTKKGSYATPAAFLMALKRQVQARAAETGRPYNRGLPLLVMERFAARVMAEYGNHVLIKGGLALELQLERARTTRDIDLRVDGDPSAVLDRLRAAGTSDLGDRLAFRVEEHPAHPEIVGDGVRYEGTRYRAEAQLAGRRLGDPFGVDVAHGDPLIGPTTTVPGSDLLSFAGIEAPMLRLVPRETHVAEKLHALTMPRDRPNSRVRDLPDLALLGSSGKFDGAELREAIETTFAFRGTHAVPGSVPGAPERWRGQYLRLAAENDLRWTELDEVLIAVRSFLDPVLAGGDLRWSPESWVWSHGGGA